MSDDDYDELAELFGAVQRWLGAWHRAMNFADATDADRDLLLLATEDLDVAVDVLLSMGRER